MARLFYLPIALLSGFLLSTGALQAATASDPRTDTVTINVSAIKEIALADGTLTTTLSSGSSTENFVTYSYSSNASRNLVARLVDTGEVPAGLEIAVTATAPGAGGTPAVEVTLTGTYQNIVTGIPAGVDNTGIQITAKATITGSPTIASHPIQIEFALDP